LNAEYRSSSIPPAAGQDIILGGIFNNPLTSKKNGIPRLWKWKCPRRVYSCYDEVESKIIDILQ
jgi:hypothetical protein